jgi:hypothetical protein
MTSKQFEEELADAEDAFQRKPANPEIGLEHVTDSSVLQLRKACRLLDAAGFLLERDGHFTVIIEASFVAMERSIQFYVEEKNYDVPGQRGSVQISWFHAKANDLSHSSAVSAFA